MLEVSEFADVLAAEPIGVLNIEREGLKALGASISAGLEGGTAYVPCVAVGRDVGGGFEAGPVRRCARRTTRSRARSRLHPDRLRGGHDRRVGAADRGLTRPRTAHRAARIFDRIGPAARTQGGDLARLRPAELVSLRAGAAPDFPPALTSHWLTLHTGTVGGEALAAKLQDTDVPSTLVNATRCWHMLREMSVALFAPDAGVALAADGPNVVAVTVEQVPGEAARSASVPSLDIWRAAAWPYPSRTPRRLRAPAILAGVLPHLAERLLAGDAVRDPALPARPSVGAIFEVGDGARYPHPGGACPREETHRPAVRG